MVKSPIATPIKLIESNFKEIIRGTESNANLNTMEDKENNRALLFEIDFSTF